MTILPAVAGAPAMPHSRAHASNILTAAQILLPRLEAGERIDAAILRRAMETAIGATDASGAWEWKLAYEACEVATALFLRKFGKPLFRKAATPAARLDVLTRIADLLPTHTRRSEESQTLQQFSTPLPLGLAALTAAGAPGRYTVRVLENPRKAPLVKTVRVGLNNNVSAQVLSGLNAGDQDVVGEGAATEAPPNAIRDRSQVPPSMRR